MKNKLIHKRIFTLLIVLLMASCENTKLDLLTSPNSPSLSNVNLETLYNRIQLSFGGIQSTLEDQTGEITRMYSATSGNNYGAETLPSVFDGLWANTYANLLPDIDLLEELAESRGLDIHRGTARIMKAYSIMAMVDVFGSIPYSEAGKGIENLNPKVDEGSMVYIEAEKLLDEAIVLLTDSKATKPNYDNFYAGKTDKWIRLANTLKLRSAFYKKDLDAFNTIISEDNFIEMEEHDFQFNYGMNRINPNSRHPRYNNMYETNDGDYMSNYYMWLLSEEKYEMSSSGEEVTYKDPRIRYYFFRKKSSSVAQPTNTYSCVLSIRPDQTKKPDEWGTVDRRIPYCYASEDGYIGRDHLNDSGIPPDGPIRTSYGLYPAGGDFDANDFSDTRKGGETGGLGEGILPVMLASYVDFMRAEVAMSLENDPTKAKMHLMEAIKKSLEKMKSFESLVSGKMSTSIEVPGGSKTVKEIYGMTESKMTEYMELVGRLYDASTDKLDVIIKEYYIAAFGNGLEAYNMYRRTGKPLNMVPPLQPEGAGKFPRSLRYANAFVDRNLSVDQKKESDRVFWDDGSTVLR